MKKIIWNILFVLYLLVLIYFSVTPKPPFNYSRFYGEDKIWHFLAYAGGMFLFLKGLINKKWYIIPSIGLILTLPVASEYIQALSPYRQFSLYDSFASYLGILSIILVFYISKKFINYKRKAA
ncbi:hypothetical protein Marpi_1835 [Marinitoga piezophila KA3]|uniref:Integral membrane protein n=1 Tax=Marinitoga piezophila (strain DSM 14283 / JCM 11233 / KA3) TaxID=443254 RepID=H2J5Z7_MARPK|nr:MULTISPECIES: hypothetical protein [Marinitoga]AEX86216.1 hypothetical protein Marpi_1835 [Marinitoga piezophila KA3]APT76629.1 hypothetical protein LN42_09745 [Marinitoga sp. 1137]NUU98325.1 hypothetical protein [Marinitoga sp. 1138]